MIVAHYNAALEEAFATIHGAHDREWDHRCAAAVAMLRHLAQRGTKYRIRFGRRERIGYL